MGGHTRWEHRHDRTDSTKIYLCRLNSKCSPNLQNQAESIALLTESMIYHITATQLYVKATLNTNQKIHMVRREVSCN